MDMREYSFYFGGAYVVETYQIGRYKLWLPDLSDKDKQRRWESGEMIPDKECVIANRNYVIDLDDNETTGEVAGGHFVLAAVEITPSNPNGINLTTLSPDMVTALSLPARVAISEELWNQIPVGARPLPPKNRDQAYRLQVVVRFTEVPTGAETVIVRRGFVGFHVQVVANADDGRKQVQFWSWTDGDLNMHLIDLTDPMFDPVSNGHSTISADSNPGEEGALFIAVDRLSALPGVDIPKVPFGAQVGGHADAIRGTPQIRRNAGHRLEIRP